MIETENNKIFLFHRQIKQNQKFSVNNII